MLADGVMVILPLEGTLPIPVMLTAEAFDTLQLKFEELPAATVEGLAEKLTIVGIFKPGGGLELATTTCVEFDVEPWSLKASITYVVVEVG